MGNTPAAQQKQGGSAAQGGRRRDRRAWQQARRIVVTRGASFTALYVSNVALQTARPPAVIVTRHSQKFSPLYGAMVHRWQQQVAAVTRP
jgi:hypothetical protein